MTEPKKTRWDICERCIRNESNLSQWCNLLLWRVDALNYVKKNKRRKWQNMFSVFTGAKRNIDKLCSKCPFAMEHAVLGQELQDD